MLRWIIGSSLRGRRVVVALAAVLVAVGILRIADMPREVLPEFSRPTVEVQTEALGLSASEVEELITVPLEQDLLDGVAFLDTIRSQSIPGLSSIQMIFEPGTDLLDARQVVEERLTQAHALPQVSKPPQMLQPLSSTSRVMLVGLSSERLSLIDMSLLARWKIRPRLMGVPGVANVSVWGHQEKQLQVLVDPDRLRGNGVSLQQIIETAANAQFVSNLSFVEASTPGTGGIIETPTQRFGVQHAVPFASPGDLAKVVVEGTEDEPLRLGDVADIVVDHQQLIGDAVFLDRPGLLLVVERLPGANTVEVSQGVEEALEALRPGLSGVAIDTSLFRPARAVETASDNLRTALIIGAVLLLFGLVALLFDWRTASVSAIAIAVSLVAACLVLDWFDTTLDAMIVAGLVLAVVAVVDDGVGDAETVARRIRERRDEGNPVPVPRIVLDTAVEMRSAGIYAVLISLVALVPVFFIDGPFGTFFPSVARSYAVAVLASMVVALIVTPALGVVLLSGGRADRRTSFVSRWLRPRYERGLSRIAGSWRPTLVVVAAVALVGIAAMPFLERSLTPSFEDLDLLVHLNGPPGTSLSEMDRIAGRVGDEIRGITGVVAVGGHSGRAVLSDQIVDTSASELWVNLDPRADQDATRTAIDDAVQRYPGLDSSVVTYTSERIDEVLSRPADPVTVRIFGEDLGILHDKAVEIQQVLSDIDGVEAPRIQAQPVEPTLNIEVDLDAAERYGVVPGDVRRAASTLLSGIQVGSLFDEQKVFEVVVWGTPEIRHDLSSIQELSIDTRDGGHVRLGDVADVELAPSPQSIQHVDISRSIDVTAGVSGRTVGDVANDVERRIRDVAFPLEYHAEVVGDFQDGQAADREAIAFALAAAIAVFLLLQSAVGNWRLASLVFLLLPVCLSGGAVAALIDGGVISLGSVAGFLGMLGIAARQAIMQIRDCRGLQRSEHESFGRDLLVRAAGERLSPSLISAVVIALAFAPLVFAGGIAGLEIVHPMGVVILGGLVSSTLVTTIVVPSLLLRFGAYSEPDLSASFAEPVVDLTGSSGAAEGDTEGSELIGS